MMCGFHAHHRLRDSSVSWLLSFSPVVMGADTITSAAVVLTAGKMWL